jgi:hypothetical protein
MKGDGSKRRTNGNHTSEAVDGEKLKLLQLHP